MSPPSIRKAVLPVAGRGTRFLPATKVVPKEMLPVVDRPLIQYAVEEAVDAGIDEIIFVSSQSKRSIEDHFDRSPELELLLHLQDRHDLLTGLNRVLPPHVSYACVRQTEPLGLGDAILCARSLIGDEPFAVLAPSDLIDATPGALAQMVERYAERAHSILAVESPTHGMIGRYIFTPEIFDHLESLRPGRRGEVDLAEGIRGLVAAQSASALEVTGRRFDCSTKLGFITATLHYALKHPEIGGSVADLVGAVAAKAAAGAGPQDHPLAA